MGVRLPKYIACQLSQTVPVLHFWLMLMVLALQIDPESLKIWSLLQTSLLFVEFHHVLMEFDDIASDFDALKCAFMILTYLGINAHVSNFHTRRGSEGIWNSPGNWTRKNMLGMTIVYTNSEPKQTNIKTKFGTTCVNSNYSWIQKCGIYLPVWSPPSFANFNYFK